MNTPDFFIVGAPKCGTTALAYYLSQHPQVFMSTPKEPHYFNTDHHHRGVTDWNDYLSLFSQIPSGTRRIGEASVWYLYSRTAIANIEKTINDPRYIVMLRNPVTMAPSLHEQLVFSGNEAIKSFEKAWHAQSQRRASRSIPKFVNDPSYLLYREACSLGKQLERMLEIVPRDRVLILFQDEMALDTASTWRDVMAFLGLPYQARTEFPLVNGAKARRWALVKRLNDWYAWMIQEKGIPPLRLGWGAALDRYNIMTKKREPLSDAMRAELIASFTEDIDKLSQITGRNLDHWLH